MATPTDWLAVSEKRAGVQFPDRDALELSVRWRRLAEFVLPPAGDRVVPTQGAAVIRASRELCELP